MQVGPDQQPPAVRARRYAHAPPIHASRDHVEAGDGPTPPLIGTSPMMERARQLVEEYATIADPVAVVGPTGTGKGLVARLLHARSGRPGRLVHVPGGELVETLYHKQLYGHAKGAYTGAYQDAPGAFQQAAGGTLFLDELQLWSPAAQAAILRAVEDGSIRPLGAHRDVFVDCRIIVGSNRPLEALASEGRLMEDLRYRLGDFAIELAGLAERRADIAVLAYHFLEDERRSAPTTTPLLFTAEALERLLAYDWPGNVRELRGAIRFAVVNAGGAERIGVEHLPLRVRTYPGDADAALLREVTAWVFAECGRRRREAAWRLGVHPNTIDYRLRQHGRLIPRPRHNETGGPHEMGPPRARPL